LLAVLSHASVAISNVGILVPLVIYAVQRDRSSYVRFHALQALVLQILAFIFNILSWFCLIGALFIPLITAALSASGQIPESYPTGISILLLVILFLMTAGNFAFILYGLIGAFRTYQGHDFRYVFIADRIAKMPR
jgi:uncharacterized Tic20 family protein